MNNTTIFVGMDVHKESFTLCEYQIETEKASHFRHMPADYKEVLRDTLNSLEPSTEGILSLYAVMRPVASAILYIIS